MQLHLDVVHQKPTNNQRTKAVEKISLKIVLIFRVI